MDKKKRIERRIEVMLSETEKQVRDLIENKLSGNVREEARLFHISVERKLEAMKMWFQEVETILPDIIPTTGTYSTGDRPEQREPLSLESTLNRMSAYIDAFFMSAKSTLDAFAHELRSLYGLGGHSGDLYFDNAIALINTHHSDTELNNYLISTNVKNIQWYLDLNSYRRASAHESIIQIKPSMDLDFLSGEWKNLIIKLPIDPTQRPLTYDGKNFVDTGKTIKDNLSKFVVEGYDAILNDTKKGKTKIS